MTEEELARTLCRAHVEGGGGWGEGAWLAVARRARELLCAQPQPVPLPPEPAPGFVRVRIPVWVSPEGFIVGPFHTKPGNAGTLSGARRSIVAADVPLPQPPAEVTGRVET